MKKSILLYILFMFVCFICLSGCNKTGIKGTVLYGPTSAPMEGITVKAVPRLDTEERTSLTKSTTTDKNGEYKITGLEPSYSYSIIINDDKMNEAGRNKNQTIVSFLTKDQTKIIDKPIIVFDVLPGIGCYVKTDDGKFEPIREFKRLSALQFMGTFRRIDDGNAIHGTVKDPNFYYTSQEDIKSSNPTKIKNGEIIFFNIESDGRLAITDWYISPIGKVNYSEDCKFEVENIGLNNLLVAANTNIGKFSDSYYGTTLSLVRYNIIKKSTSKEKYYQISLGEGYYLASSYDFTDRSNSRNNPVRNFIFEVVDNPIEEGEYEEDQDGH